ncbi:MAG TPA: apolipoprotein N-acyltransferase [Noviherbaspirillum sp.]|nr:apolipoprotein N-acyltransferase [Noviherbaspirillum sp.]HJW55788.1 apolipoprotein N-acyltransferase [Burkholderiaceae bacterium]
MEANSAEHAIASVHEGQFVIQRSISLYASCVVAGGSLYAASFAPLGWWPAQFAALGLLQFCALELGRRKRGRLLTALLSLLFAIIAFGAGATWVYEALHRYSGQGKIGAFICSLAFVLYLSAFVVAPSLLAAWAKHKGASDILALSLFTGSWLCGEWLRSQFWGGYTLEAVGYAHVDSWLQGYGPVFGVYGLTIIVLSMTAFILVALRHPGNAHKVAAITLFIVVLAGGVALSHVEWTEPVGEPLRVRLLQGNVTQLKKFESEGRHLSLNVYQDLITAQPADIILTPETALPLFLDELPTGYMQSLRSFAENTGSTVIVGIPVLSTSGAAYDSMLGIMPRSQDRLVRYDKIHLSPVGEYAPAGLGWLTQNFTIPLKDFSPGDFTQPTWRIKGQVLGMNICHEDLFGEELADRLQDATILVNASNLAWFHGSVAFWQRTQASRMRALELGRPVLRVANTGTTALIDIKGQVTQSLPDFQRGVLDGVVRGRRGTTPYTRWENHPALTASILLCLLSTVCVIRRPA